MFPIKTLDKINEELHRYYLQIITFQNEDLHYQDIAAKFSKNLSELEDVIVDIKKYNNNKKNNPLIHIFK
jgi:hypothetical protein